MNSTLMMASYSDQKQKLNNFPKLEPVTCNRNNCGCGAEIILDKELI